jgi:hypothetical protein
VTQELSLYIGLCQKALPTPYVTSELVACEAEGCDHMVWCDSNSSPAWHVLKVVCHHCTDSLMVAS